MKKGLWELHTEAFTAQRDWTVEGIPVLSATISLPKPVPATGKIARRINRYYQLQGRSYLRYCENWIFPQAAAEYHAALSNSTPLPHFTADLTYCVTYNEGGLWSLYTQSREKGGGHTLRVRRGDTWDLRDGYPLPLPTLMRERSYKKRLLEQAATEIQRQESAGVARYHEGWRRRLRRYFNAQNYYLTAEGLVFFYPMYTIAPSAEGIPTFILPYGDALCQLPLRPPDKSPQEKP